MFLHVFDEKAWTDLGYTLNTPWTQDHTAARINQRWVKQGNGIIGAQALLMKRFQRMIVLVLLLFNGGGTVHAQVLDTMSRHHFTQLSYRQISGLFKDDPAALRIIRGKKRGRDLAYAFYGGAVLMPCIALTDKKNTLPGIIVLGLGATATGMIINRFNAKAVLYQSLRSYENNKYRPGEDSVRQMTLYPGRKLRISQTSDEQFRQMSSEARMRAFVYDDTTRLIFSHHDKYLWKRDVMAASALLAWAAAGAAAYQIAVSIPSEINEVFGAFMVASTFSGIGFIISSVHFAEVSSRETLYLDLSLYAEQHQVTAHTAAYIRKYGKREIRRWNAARKRK